MKHTKYLSSIMLGAILAFGGAGAYAAGTADMQVSAKFVPKSVCSATIQAIDFQGFGKEEIDVNGHVKTKDQALTVSCSEDTVFWVKVDDQNPDDVTGNIGSAKMEDLFGMHDDSGSGNAVKAAYTIKLNQQDSDVSSISQFRIMKEGGAWEFKDNNAAISNGSQFAYRYIGEGAYLAPSKPKNTAVYGIQADLYVDRDSVASATTDVDLTGGATFTVMYP